MSQVVFITLRVIQGYKKLKDVRTSEGGGRMQSCGVRVGGRVRGSWLGRPLHDSAADACVAADAAREQAWGATAGGG